MTEGENIENKDKKRKVIQFRLNERDEENLQFIAGLTNPKVTATEALRAGLEMYCDKMSGGIRRVNRAVIQAGKVEEPEYKIKFEEGMVLRRSEIELEGDEKEEYIKEKRTAGYIIEDN